MQRLSSCVLILAIVLAVSPNAARSQTQNKPPATEQKPAASPAAASADRFELKDGDRVVFLGNTFFEREGRYGYIETMLTTRYPGKRITFRNLGWSGDTVWGESRGYFEPENGYQNLIDLVAELKPTVIFLAYGNNEAFAGKEGLEPFIKQYDKLLDDLEKVTKRIVILDNLVLQKHDPPLPDMSKFNTSVALYNKAIEAIANERQQRFLPIDVPESKLRATDDGLHLNNVGYAALANHLGQTMNHNGPPAERAEELRRTIIAKNQLFFYRWRPQNTTYLLGFRKHEQGQNAKEIVQFDPLIAAKEEEIFKLARPVSQARETNKSDRGGEQ